MMRTQIRQRGPGVSPQDVAENCDKDLEDGDGGTVRILTVTVNASLLVNAPLLTGSNLLDPIVVAKAGADDCCIKKVFK